MDENSISQLAKGSNRIVVTQQVEFNPKDKKDNIVIADIRDSSAVKCLIETIKIDTATKGDPGWMTVPEIYINFMDNKTLIFSFGVLIDCWVRSAQWEGDYVIHNYNWFHDWLLENGILYFQKTP